MNLNKNNKESYQTEGLKEAVEKSKVVRVAIGVAKGMVLAVCLSAIATLSLASESNIKQGLSFLPIRQAGDVFLAHSAVQTDYTILGTQVNKTYCVSLKDSGLPTRDCLTIQGPYYEKEGEIVYDSQVFYDGDNGIKLSNVEKEYIINNIYDTEGLLNQDFIEEIMTSTKKITQPSELVTIPDYNEYQITLSAVEENFDDTKKSVVTTEDADAFNQNTLERGTVFASFGSVAGIAWGIERGLRTYDKQKQTNRENRLIKSKSEK